jgi:hypothetical protein
MRSHARAVSTKARAAALTAAAVLALLGAAYYFTYEPAPQVTIRWREGVTSERRADVERRFGLVRARDPEGRAVAYDLVDTRPENVEELLEQPEVDDSGYAGGPAYVSADLRYGRGGTWIGDRHVTSPELRIFRVVPVIVTACGLVIAYTLGRQMAARRHRIRRLLAFIVGSRRPRFRSAGARLGDRGGGRP